jgi:hypothetical protein
VRRLSGQKSWMTQDLFIKWINFEFPFIQRDTVLLVFDSARAHISAKVKAHLHARGILFAVIPGGLTPLLQPCDVAWFKPLKSHIKESIDAWIAGPNHEYTRAGNPRPPTTENMSNWLWTAWQSIATDLISNSFRRCFLGDCLFLHIAQHEIYGEKFRARVAELSTFVSTIEPISDILDESDPGDIYDE